MQRTERLAIVVLTLAACRPDSPSPTPRASAVSNAPHAIDRDDASPEAAPTTAPTVNAVDARDAAPPGSAHGQGKSLQEALREASAAASARRFDGSAPDQQRFDGSHASPLSGVAVQSCKSTEGPTGAGHVTITFGPSGEVIAATVDGPSFAGTAVGECVLARFRERRVPPFGSPVKVGKTFAIN